MTLLLGQYTLHIELQIVLKVECYRSFWPSKVSSVGVRAVKSLLGKISACCISRVAPWQSVRTLSGQSQVTLISKSWNQIAFSQWNAGCATCADDTHETFYHPYTYSRGAIRDVQHALMIPTKPFTALTPTLATFHKKVVNCIIRSVGAIIQVVQYVMARANAHN